MKTLGIPYFGGIVASADPLLIKPFQCQDALNAMYDNGALRSRRGYRNIRAVQANFVAAYGLVYTAGYNSSYAEVEEYVSFESISGTVKAFSRHVTTGAPTAITGASGLNASEWTGLVFNDTAYFLNPSDTNPVYRHTIGDIASWTAVATPADPTTALGFQLVYTAAGGTTYDQLSWAGLDPTSAGEMAVTGAAQNTGSVLNADNTFTIRHNTNQGPASVELDLSDITAGNQDWSYTGAIAFPLVEDPSNQFHIDPASVDIVYTNDDGSPLTFNPVVVAARVSAMQINVWVYTGEQTRADWDNIATWKLSYNIIQRSTSAANNNLTVGKPFLGCCFPFPDVGNVSFKYTYYYSTPDLESGLGGEKLVWGLDTQGYNPLGGGGGGIALPPSDDGGAGVTVAGGKLGSFQKFTFTTSGDANVDNNRLYWFDNFSNPSGAQFANVHRRIVTQADGTPTYTVKMSYAELRALTVYNPAPFSFTRVTNAFPFKGWVVWLLNQGLTNVRHSRVGEALKLHSNADPDDDDNRGADFTLSDNASDTPLGGIQAGDSALIAGKQGVYEQTGDRPWNMSPPKKLSGSFGVAGKFAFARWKDDYGNPGMVFVDANGTGIYFAIPSGVQNFQAEGKVLEISGDLRDKVRAFLLYEQTSLSLSDFSTCRVVVDEAQDAVFVFMGARFFKLPRPSIASGRREWQLGRHNLGADSASWAYFASSTKRRIRALRSTGQFDELEWNSAANVWIEGPNRDGGNPMPPGFWKSKTFGGSNRRVDRLYIPRSRVWEEARVRVHSRRKTQMYKALAAHLWTKCLAVQQGNEHIFEVLLDEREIEYTGLDFTEVALSPRRNS